MSPLFTKYLKDSSWVLAGNLASRGFNLATITAIARLLGPSAFGAYNLTLASADSFAQMADLGTSVVVQRTYAAHPITTPALPGNRFAAAIWLFIFFYALLYAVLILADQFNLTKNLLPVEGPVLMLLLVSFTTRINQFVLVPLTGLQQFKKHSFRTTLNAAILLVTAGVGAWWSGLPGALYGVLLANCLSILITGLWLYKAHQRYAMPINLFHGIRAIPTILKQGFLLYVGNTLSGAIYSLVLVGLVMKHIPLVEYGYLRIGLSLASLVGVFVAALQPVTLSALATGASGPQHNQLKSITIRIIFCLVLLGMLWLIALNDLLVIVLFGRLYLSGMSIIAAMLVIMAIQVLNQFYVGFLIAKGHGNFIGVMAILTISLSVALAYWLIPVYGIWGYLISYGSGYLAGLVISFRKEISTTDYRDRANLTGVFLYTVLLLLGACLSTRIPSLGLRIGLCATLTALFGGGWYLLILHTAERQLAVSILHKFRNYLCAV